MLSQALQFVLETIGNLFLVALLLRFYMQLMQVSFRNNPFAQFIIALTDFVVRPLRRVIPGLWGMDLATLLLAWLIEFILVLTLSWLDGFPFLAAGTPVLPGFVLLAIVRLVKLGLYMIIGLIFIQAILSWVNPFSPMAPVFNSLTRPFLRPVQRVMPPVGNVDLSPLVVMLVCQIIIMLPITWLERHALNLV